MYESRLSLAARFAHLNRISISQCHAYFEGALSENRPCDLNTLEKVAKLLDEDYATLKETFAPSLDLPRGPGTPARTGELAKTVRYCEDCVACGYHSYLHEYTWLARCPFHAIPLKLKYPQARVGSHSARRCETLAQLMSDACSYWPSVGNHTFEPDKYESFVWLTDWLPRVFRASALFSKNRIWSSSKEIFPEIRAYSHMIGRLHALEPIPPTMRPLFDDVQDGWTAEIQQFPIEAKREVSEVIDLGTDFLFLLYKIIAAYAVSPPGLARDVASCIQELQSRHLVCRCEWGLEKAGFAHHWVRVHSDGWQHWNVVCPFTVAKEKLQLAAGQRLEVLTRRKRGDEEIELIVHSHSLLERGLINTTPGANVSPEGRLYGAPQIWPPFEWVGTPWLNIVLDAATRCEVGALHRSLCEWLDGIDDGESPAHFAAPPPLIWLSEIEDGLVLIEWRRKRKAE